MSLGAFSLKNRLLVYVLTILATGYGLITYQNMGKLEDPEFTIKDIIVTTQYTGATAEEVEKEVTNLLEQSLQELQLIKKIVSKSSTNQSLIKITVKDRYKSDDMPQVWDIIRKKVNDTARYLPPKASTPIVNDDFGDVFGILLAIYGDEYTYNELKDYVDFLKRELNLVDGVGKISTFGEQQRAIFIEFDRDRVSKLGINKNLILKELSARNLVSNFGKVNVGGEHIQIVAQSSVNSVESIGNTVISLGNSQIFLKDIATIRDGYIEPASTILKYNGHQAIAIGISTIKGGNVVKMGENLNIKLEELQKKKPLGVEIAKISHQAESVEKAISSFIVSLIEAVLIVIAVLLLFMGLRSGLIIGSVLVITIMASFTIMPEFGVLLERISLGALIIALGMLVDNAIVVVDGILSRIDRGMDRVEAAKDVVQQTALPLLAATAVAILAFGAIGLSEDSTGEFTRSLFLVILISLSLSWVTAMTITPLLSVQFLKPKKGTEDDGGEHYNSTVYKIYGKILSFSLKMRYPVLFLSIGILIVSLYNFQFVKQNFFPDSSRSQILVDYILPQGNSIDRTESLISDIQKRVEKIDGVENISTFIGSGTLRFILTYAPVEPNRSYAQMLIDIDDYQKADSIINEIERVSKVEFHDITTFGKKFILGPGDGGKVQVKIFGEDLSQLREYEQQILNIFRDEPLAKGIRTDWREKVKIIKPIISEERANLNGISRDDISNAILDTFQGRRVGVYRDNNELVPIIVQSPEQIRDNVKNLENILIFSPVANKMIPLRQVVTSFETEFIDDIIYRYNRKRALTVHTDPINGVLANELLSKVKDRIDSIDYKDGYHIEWHGEYKSSKDAQKPIAESLPLFFTIMLLIVLALFNSGKKTAVIWLIVPFALVGVVWGLLLMDKAFGFMSMLGFLSLSGMLIKNAIVLIDEITIESEQNRKNIYNSIYDSGLNRLRAVTMAALTTALGMLPLINDAFFSSMAVVIIFGLMVGTFLIMILVPVLYSIFYEKR